MTSSHRRQGFSLLEMVIAIFIIAVVVAFSLSLLARGLGNSAKSSDLTIATALAEQEMSRIKNITFPPTTVDRQGKYAKTKTDADIPYNNDFQVEVTSTGYDGSDPPSTTTVNDDTMLRKITVNVYRKRGDAKLVTLITYIARNGTI
ncbi:MAG: prepilin-type N-terminal cleavage/methylation domain-containing protein [Candidatus Omnitrophota bacterium]